MMDEDRFRNWLDEGGVRTKSVQTRVSAIREIERKLEKLEMPFRDLEAAWEEDRFKSLHERLRRMREDADDGRQDYRILMPSSEDPRKQLSGWCTWLKQYGWFLGDEPRESAKDAYLIRQHVLEHHIEPARKEGRREVEVPVRDVNTALELNDAWPNICQALTGNKFRELAQIPEPDRIKGSKGSSAAVLRFDLSSHDTATEPPETDASPDTGRSRETPMPENLILYGPPGTGKTYSSAAEAVRLCGEPVPEDREVLMQAYQRLRAEGRIEFVTFHQSMSYEDFVEGRQPVTESDEEGGIASAGFRLETVPGIFRDVAKRAERSGDGLITVAGRRVFKMSIGEGNNPEDAHLFDEAMAGGYAGHGFGDVDWSDDKYADRKAIVEAAKTEHGRDDVSALSGVAQTPFIFRNWVRKGDIVIVSKGNLLFRAIGEFTGDYEFHPRPERGYAHRRAVRWYWVDREGVPVDEIYARRFSGRTFYLLYNGPLNIPALERYLNSQQVAIPGEPESFVLIIDEINRANISKVFGELITLLEPDKRLGQPNELKVRLPYSGDDFGVPSNLHLLGTMNTADRSIALLDTALRRRFTFREMMPEPSRLAEAAEKCGLDLPQILSTINERIEYLYDREHQIGHACFMGCTSRGDVDRIMRHLVIPLLAEYFFEDWEKIAAVLGDAASHEGPITGRFLNRSVLKAPPGHEDGDAQPRFRWEIRSEDEGFDYTRLTETT